MDIEKSIDEGTQSLIDNVCSSGLNTPDINTDVFSQFDFDIKQRRCTPDDDYSVSDLSFDQEMIFQEEKLIKPPASPSFYSDHFDGKGYSLGDRFVGEVLGGSLPMELANANSNFESKNSKDNLSATQNCITPPNENYPTYDNFSTYQQPSNEAESRFFNSSGFSSNGENTVLMPELHISNPSSGNLIHTSPSEVDSVINDMKQESLDQLKKLDSLNESCVREKGNILFHAIQDNGMDQDVDLNSRYIKEKIDSFLIYDDKFTSTNKASYSPERQNSLFNRTDVDPNSILESFESSFGKQNQVRVIKNVKIVFTPQKGLNEEPTGPPITNSQASGMCVQVLLHDNYYCNVGTSVAGSKLEPVAPTSYAKEPKSPEPSSSHEGSKRCIKRPARYSVSPEQDSTDEEAEADTEVNFNYKTKKTKFSLEGLSDAQKYKRIRKQNNIASKKCRDKKKLKVKLLAEDHKFSKKINTQLKDEYAALERRVKMYKEIYFQQKQILKLPNQSNFF